MEILIKLLLFRNRPSGPLSLRTAWLCLDSYLYPYYYSKLYFLFFNFIYFKIIGQSFFLGFFYSHNHHSIISCYKFYYFSFTNRGSSSPFPIIIRLLRAVDLFFSFKGRLMIFYCSGTARLYSPKGFWIALKSLVSGSLIFENWGSMN